MPLWEGGGKGSDLAEKNVCGQLQPTRLGYRQVQLVWLGFFNLSVLCDGLCLTSFGHERALFQQSYSHPVVFLIVGV